LRTVHLPPKLCVIQVTIEGTKNKQTFDLLVDSGAETTFLTTAMAKIVGVHSQEKLNLSGATGSSNATTGIVRNIEIIQKIEVQGEEIEQKISLGSSKIGIIDRLPPRFSEYSIIGILGVETIQELCLKIDYPEKYLELSKKVE